MQTPALERISPASLTTALVTRLHRYKALLLRRWWIPVLTICLGLFVGAWIFSVAALALAATVSHAGSGVVVCEGAGTI